MFIHYLYTYPLFLVQLLCILFANLLPVEYVRFNLKITVTFNNRKLCEFVKTAYYLYTQTKHKMFALYRIYNLQDITLGAAAKFNYRKRMALQNGTYLVGFSSFIQDVSTPTWLIISCKPVNKIYIFIVIEKGKITK